METAVEPREVTVGEPIHLKVTLIADRSGQWQPFSPVLTGTPFEVIAVSSNPVQQNPAGARQEITLSLRLFEVGVSTLPPQTFRWVTPGGATQSVQTPDIPIRVRSVLTEKDKDLHGMKGGLKKVLDRKRLAALLAVLLTIGLAVFFFRHRHRRLHPNAGPPPRPPHETALDALTRLEIDIPGPDKPFYSRLTEIWRIYLEGRFGVPAMDQTTAETAAALKTLPITSEDRLALRGVLDNSDLAKFAKWELTPEEKTGDLERVRRFVLSTRPEPSVQRP